jgi:uncharacterized protein with von Willebrand factor type A (vWA) domain
MAAMATGMMMRKKQPPTAYRNSFRKKIFRCAEDEVDELMQTIRALSKRLAAGQTKGMNYPTKLTPDLRQTLRKNMRCGGELIDIVHRKPKRNRINLCCFVM